MEILEYCEPSDVISREQYYIDLLKPDYNILQVAGSSLGYKHTEESKVQITTSQPNCIKIEVLDLETNTTASYDSINAAAKGIGCRHWPIQYHLKTLNTKPYKGRYVFKSYNYSS